MKFAIHSHCQGDARVPRPLRAEVEVSILEIDVRSERGAARRLRDQFLANIRSKGWSGELSVARGSDMSITSIKDGVGLCLQTGNMARMYADLVKLQTLYLDNGIMSAVFVLPSHPTALQLGDNIASAARLERELEIFRKAYFVPTLLFALEG